jgi:RNA polymerase sigma-32 factor
MSINTPALQHDQGLSLYIKQVNGYSLLTAEREYMLAKRVTDYQDVEAAHSLVTSHLRLVVKIALNMRGYGISLMDLISEGNIGLMHAVKKFKPDLGYRLSTYAMWWIKASMQEFIIKSWSLVKIGTTVAQKKLFFNLNKIKRKIQNLEGIDSTSNLSIKDAKFIANELQLDEKDVLSMNHRLNSGDVSLDNPILSRDGEESGTLLETIVDNKDSHELKLAEDQELNSRRRLFRNAVTQLNDREKDIVVSRRLQEKAATLEDLSKKYNVSRERVRQIEVRALEKIKGHCKIS